MDRVTRFLTTRLKLTVNASKSAVARPQERTFLGFTFTAGPTVARAIAPKAVRRFKTKVREITRRAKGVSLETTIAELAPYMRGWRNYFGFCETPEALVYLTRWVRLRLRAALWRQWRTPRRRRAALLALGVRPRLAEHTAGSGLGPWYLARAKALSVGLSNALLRLARPSAIDRRGVAQPTRTAVYGPVRTVVWQGSAGDRRPYADQTPQCLERPGGDLVSGPPIDASECVPENTSFSNGQREPIRTHLSIS